MRAGRSVFTAIFIALVSIAPDGGRRANAAAPAASGAASTAPSGAASGIPSRRAKIEARLQNGGRGLSPSAMSELAREGSDTLAQIAADRTAALPVRARAMSALAYAHTPAAHDFLENFVIRNLPSTDPADHQLLRKAAIALGWQAGGRSVEVLGLLLEHPDPEVRLDAALALGLTRAHAAEKPLRARLGRESDPAVRAQLESQLRALASPPADPAPPAR